MSAASTSVLLPRPQFSLPRKVPDYNSLPRCFRGALPKNNSGSLDNVSAPPPLLFCSCLPPLIASWQTLIAQNAVCPSTNTMDSVFHHASCQNQALWQLWPTDAYSI